MPYKIRKVSNKNCYKVINAKTKKVHAKCTSKKNAEKQVRLLKALDYNPSFKLRNRTQKNRV
jgi:hypothetical protein